MDLQQFFIRVSSFTSGRGSEDGFFDPCRYLGQLHDISIGFKTAQVCKDLGNYIGSFVEGDPKNFMGLWRDFLRIRVTLDVLKSLKRRRKIGRTGGESFWVNFKYEHMPIFCFLCGLMGHSESFCPSLIDTPSEQIVKLYGSWMRAVPRRRNVTMGDKWLKTLDDISLADTNVGGNIEPQEHIVDVPHAPMVVEQVVVVQEIAQDSLLVVDAKRKRVDLVAEGDKISGQIMVKSSGLSSIIAVEGGSSGCQQVSQLQDGSVQVSKNLKKVGAGFQTHLES